jgi:5-methylcytosine-specific restriction endonuclease McrA
MDPFFKHSREHRVEASKVTDHIIPHRGNLKLFKDPLNLGSLCVSCHNQKTFLESHGEVVTYPRLSVQELQDRALLGVTSEEVTA